MGKLSVVMTNKEPPDPDLFTWDGPEDPANPKNWSVKEKWILTIFVSLFAFISLVSSSMMAPALAIMDRVFGMQNGYDVELEKTISIFVLGCALGPLRFGPIPEVFGRTRVSQASSLIYLA